MSKKNVRVIFIEYCHFRRREALAEHDCKLLISTARSEIGINHVSAALKNISEKNEHPDQSRYLQIGGFSVDQRNLMK